MSFAAFKKKRNATEILEKMQKPAKSYEKSEFYYPVIDKEKGTASAIIRFLPGKNTDLPYVTVYSHRFKGDDGRWMFVDLCGTTIGKECGVCGANKILWESEQEAKRKIASARKRDRKYIFNVLIVQDSMQPELEGTVQPYSCGQTIFDLITSAMKPEFEGEELKDPFDIDEGNNFMLRIRRDPAKNNQVTYDKSKFEDTKSVICDGNETKQKAVYEAMIDLNKYIDPSRLMDDKMMQDKVAAAYATCIGGRVVAPAASIPTPEPRASKAAEMDSPPWGDDEEGAGSEDEDLDFFRKLANE